ncbi:hypothetical protein LCGC14_0615830 [marine sediment metagenome]|uniref:Uncharacterized protein n=1 Tax=marine sediment metagenome TaxID=412755 RepID=A0A0F9RB30_9ZZZZ
MMFEVKESPNETIMKGINLIGAKSTRAVRQMWFSLMQDLKRSTDREILYGSKSGRLYRFKGRVHKSSAPGETHADLTGKARRSLSWKVHGSKGADFGYGVSVSARNAAPDYVDDLEFGTPGGQMAPRPTLGNAVDSIGSKAQSHFDDALRDEGL